MFNDNFFKKVENKTNVNKDTILSLANKLQESNLKDEKSSKEVIENICSLTGKTISKEKEEFSTSNLIGTENAEFTIFEDKTTKMLGEGLTIEI